MNNKIRTDLALEAQEMYRETAREIEEQISGIVMDTIEDGDITVTKVEIISEEGAQALGKPMGNYITIEAPRLHQSDKTLYADAIKHLSGQIQSIANINKDTTTLVVGLGNWNITPDAIGPKVVSYLMVTRHLLEHIPEHMDKRLTAVCAMSPGVLGTTGMETSEIIKGVVEKVKPDLVIVIDALASRRLDRLSTTIQIADTGISPGSGVGNHRKALSKETLDVPVIAIGVPTVHIMQYISISVKAA